MFVFAPSLFWKSVNKPLTLYFLQSRQETLLRLDLKKKSYADISIDETFRVHKQKTST